MSSSSSSPAPASLTPHHAANADAPLPAHRYAYLLDTDGFTSAYKLQQLLATNSAVLSHASPWRAYYHAALVAFVHYVPVWRSSRDDILRVLGWLDRHERVAQRVAANGQHFACEHLTQPGRLCYWRRAIELYAEAFVTYKPSLARRPRAFPLERLNLMCRIRDAPVVCYYNIKPQGRGPPLPRGYTCSKPVLGVNGSFEDCEYRGTHPPAL